MKNHISLLKSAIQIITADISLSVKKDKNLFSRIKNYVHFQSIKKLSTEGGHGIVYTIDGNMTLKLTDDGPEAAAALLAMKDKPKGIYSVEKVFSFQEGGDTYYGIVAELLHKDSVVAGMVSEFEDWRHKTRNLRITTENVNKFIVEHGVAKDSNWEKFYTWLEDIAKWLDSHRIRFSDLSAGNAMVRPNGDIVLIDIGESGLNPSGVPPLP